MKSAARRALGVLRDLWACRVRPHLPRGVQRALAWALRHLGLEHRLLHWLIPPCLRTGFTNLSWDTGQAVYSSLGRVAKERLPGDYYEFGLYRGFTFWLAQEAAALRGLSQMRFYGFDSFRGLPAPSRGEAAYGEFHEGEFACDRQTVERLLSRFGVDWSRTELVEGFYDTSLPAHKRQRRDGRPAAVALIDCDLYASAMDVLHYLDDRLQDGTVLLFDDWGSFEASDDHGERRAFHEFLQGRPQWRAEPLFEFGGHGQAFLLRRDSSAGSARRP